MLRGQLAHLDYLKTVSPKLAEFLAEIKDELMMAPVGRHEVQGQKFFYTVSQDSTELFANRLSEFHQDYLDIQIVLEGEERYGYSLSPMLKVTEDKLAEFDVAFGQPLEELFVILKAHEFIVFPMNCPHRPLIAVDERPQNIKKVVVKIHRSLLD